MISNFHLQFYKYRKIIFAFTIGLFIFLFSFFYHENWIDETQAWLIARDSNNIAVLLHNIRYEGHAILWYLLLFIPSHLGGSMTYMKLINATIIGAGCYLFASKTSFPKSIKILFCLSFYPIYEYGVLSRSYSLGLFFIFLMCVLYRLNKNNFIILGIIFLLLCQTDLPSIIIGISLLIFIFFNKLNDYKNRDIDKQSYVSLLLLLFTAVISVLTFLVETLPPFDSDPAILHGTGFNSILLENITNGFLPLSNKIFSILSFFQFSSLILVASIYFVCIQLIITVKNQSIIFRKKQFSFLQVLKSKKMHLPFMVLLVALVIYLLNIEAGLGLILISLSLYTLRKNKIAIFSYVAGLSMIESTFGILYPGAEQHLGLLFISYLAVAWISNEKGALRKIGKVNFYEVYFFLGFILFLQSLACFYSLGNDLVHNYSNTKQAAEYITDHNSLLSYSWAMEDCYKVRGLLGYIKHPAYFIGNPSSVSSFEVWNLSRNDTLSSKEIKKTIVRYQGEEPYKILVLSCSPIQYNNLKLLKSFTSEPIKQAEGKIYIYTLD